MSSFDSQPSISGDSRNEGGQSSIQSILDESGMAGLKETSTHDEIFRALKTIKNLIEGKNPDFRAMAHSASLKKLKEIKLPKATDLAESVFQSGKKKNGSGNDLFEEDPPWEEPVDGASLLEEIERVFRRYLVLPDDLGYTALSLWVLMAHAHETFQVSPYLVFHSPTMRCGKTTALRILQRLVPRPLPVSNISTAALFRVIEHYKPTLLIDEADTFLNRNDEINGILNAGHLRDSAYVLRADGENYEPRKFFVWSPKVIAGINKRRNTLMDRSIVIAMQRKKSDQKVEKLRLGKLDWLTPLRRKICRWAENHLEFLQDLEPTIPDGLNDRAADNWAPLLAIADLLGGPLPKRARAAAMNLSRESGAEDDSAGVQLLQAFQKFFEETGLTQVPTQQIEEFLVAMEGTPWPEWRHGKPITPNGIARLLEPFGIRPEQYKEGGVKSRGYFRVDFDEAFERYLYNTTQIFEDTSGTVGTALNNKALNLNQSGTPEAEVPPGNSVNLRENNEVPGVPEPKENVGEENFVEFEV